MHTHTPLVSIIVPVYNAQQYLSRCVDSILRQEYKNYELILIDDGSTDASGALIDDYAAKDARVRAYHTENHGVSATRNYGIDMSSGDYLQFLDSDDWMPSDSTRLLVKCATEQLCDMVIADFYRVVGERISQKGDIEDDHLLTRQEFATYMIENPADFYYGALWNKLYRTEIIKENHIAMDEQISWCEDFLFNLEYIRHSNTFYALQAPVYYYYKRKGSLVSQSFSISNTIKTKLNIFDYYNQFYKDTYADEDYENIRLHVYSFLFASAKDNMLPPVAVRGVHKLGKERAGVIPDAVALDGIAGDFYRTRKLLERFCEAIAVRNHVTTDEVFLLYLLTQEVHVNSTAMLSDLSGFSKRKVSSILQKLVKRDYVQIVNRSRSIIDILILAPAEGVLADLSGIAHEYEQTRTERFTDQELQSYLSLSHKVQKNIEDRLV